MTYNDALRYIYSFATYQKRTRESYLSDTIKLARERELLHLLGDPDHKVRSILIAGSKGKGSTAAMTASMLQAAGYNVGLYTQPHLHSHRERIRINGESISKDDLTGLVERIQPVVQAVSKEAEMGRPRTFELDTAMALDCFARKGMDFAVLEVGVGGRLDATNVVTPMVSAITSLSYEHTDILGSTLTEIAWQKAGIIKEGGRVVSAPQLAEAMVVVERVCRERKARLVVAGRDWRWGAGHASSEGQSFRLCNRKMKLEYDDLYIPLLGRHQLTNAAVAVGIIHLLKEGGVAISRESIREGLRRVRWPGRLEILSRQPLLVADGAHNADSARKLWQALHEYLDFERLILVLAMTRSKDIAGIVRELAPAAHKVVVTQTIHPRRSSVEAVQREVVRYVDDVVITEDTASALEHAWREAGPGDLICVTGSLFLVAEAREWLGLVPTEAIDEVKS